MRGLLYGPFQSGTALRESPSARPDSATCHQPFALSGLALVAARAEAKTSSCCPFLRWVAARSVSSFADQDINPSASTRRSDHGLPLNSVPSIE